MEKKEATRKYHSFWSLLGIRDNTQLFFPNRITSIRQAGFTLIEILVVVAIIGFLVSVLYTVMDPLKQLARARDAQRKSDLGQIQRALELYYQDHNLYPNFVDFGAAWSPYMSTVPNDPGGNSYYYVVDNSGNTYRLYAYLELGDVDKGSCTNRAGGCPNISGKMCGSKECNYGVSSPDTTP